jgi:hypothetical protein
LASYVPGSMSYLRYLQTQAFVDDIRWEVSQDTLKVVASVDDLKRQGVKSISAATAQVSGHFDALSQQNAHHYEAASRHYEAVESALQEGFGEVSDKLDEVSGQLENIDATLSRGFITLHYDLEAVQSSISDLSAKFDWGMYQLQTAVGAVNDSLQVLIGIARTPEQTWAYEQFDIARDAFRRKLFDDSLDHAVRAIQGFQTHPGYRLEHRFHYLVGTVRLGSFGSGDAMEQVQNLAKAEAAFLDAAKYARTDYPRDAGRALCAAGYAAYCQQKMLDAGKYNREALALHPQLPEGYFQAAKYAFHQQQANEGLALLKKAMQLDKLYAVKFDNDADFRPYRQQILGMIASVRDANASRCRAALKQLRSDVADFAQVACGSRESLGRIEAIQQVLSQAEDELRTNTYFSVLDAAAHLERSGEELRSACELNLQATKVAFTAKLASLETKRSAEMADAYRRHTEADKELQKDKENRGISISKTTGIVVGAVSFIIMMGGYITHNVRFTIIDVILNCMAAGFFAAIIAGVTAVLISMPAKVLLTGHANERISEGRRNAENELSTIDSNYRRDTVDTGAERDAILARCQSILPRIEKAFSDPWWEDIVHQQRSGQPADAAEDHASGSRHIPRIS